MTQRLLPGGVFAVALAAIGVVAGTGTARADVITFNVSANATPLLPPASCSGAGCTLGGDIVIDNSTGAVESAQLTMTGASPSLDPLTMFLGIGDVQGLTRLGIGGASSVFAELLFQTPEAGSFVGYNGGSFYGIAAGFPNSGMIEAYILTSGSITADPPAPVPTPAPAPPIGRGLPAALAVAGVLLGAGLLERRHNRRALPAA